MTTRTSFTSKTGAPLDGELAEPAGTGKVPAIVLVHEWWGVNDHIRSLATRLAAAGFLVLAPDLYHGTSTTDPGEAGKLSTALDTLVAMGEIAGATAFLRAHPRASGKVGVTGFCLGGALSLAAACHVEGLSAVVPFYGIPPESKVDWSKVTAPIQAHVASKDAWVTVAKAEAVKAKLEAAGKAVELCVYDADHAFMNDTRAEVYAPDAAKLAWSRMVSFFKTHLG
jgi:carboxymethylenebutenolidase